MTDSDRPNRGRANVLAKSLKACIMSDSAHLDDSTWGRMVDMCEAELDDVQATTIAHAQEQADVPESAEALAAAQVQIVEMNQRVAEAERDRDEARQQYKGLHDDMTITLDRD